MGHPRLGAMGIKEALNSDARIDMIFFMPNASSERAHCPITYPESEKYTSFDKC
jgi:hypothetical protein